MEYGICECGGKITEIRIKYHRVFNKKLFEFENVPVGVCRNCGERIFKGEVLEKLEKLSKSSSNFKKEIKVPVGIYT